MKHFLERQRANQCNRLPRRAARGLVSETVRESRVSCGCLSYERLVACLTRDTYASPVLRETSRTSAPA